MVWQFSALVYELYTGSRVGGLEADKRDDIQDRLTRLRETITSKNFPKLPISKFKEVFKGLDERFGYHLANYENGSSKKSGSSF